jgi:hypothetical protein
MSWADEEVKSAKLGDRRLEARFAKVLEQLGRRPQASIPVACGGWAETLAAYRFRWFPRAAWEPRTDAPASRSAKPEQ